MHGGILARRDLPEHLATLDEHGLPPIDLVVVNLYPFEATLASGADFDACIEQIDVGGPAMIRAAAKNYDGVAVVVEPGDYAALLAEFAAKGGTEARLRRRLAAKAFARTAAYDAAIAGWFARETGEEFPERVVLAGTPRAAAALRREPASARRVLRHRRARPTGLAAAPQLQGKELSFNNLNDTDTALALVAEFAEPAVAIIKHANPCGVAVGDDAGRGLPQGAGLRSAQRLRRHRRLQPAARRGRGQRDRAHLHRGRDRTRRRRRGAGRCSRPSPTCAC